MLDLHVDIAMGLPGSGKTYFYKENNTDSVDGEKVHFYHTNEFMYNKGATLFLDEFREDTDVIKTVHLYQMTLLSRALDFISNEQINDLEIDGLFTTTNTVREAIRMIAERYSDYYIDVDIRFWKPNRIACIVNDCIRNRSQDAFNSIIRHKIEKPNRNDLKGYFCNDKVNIRNVTLQGIYECSTVIHGDWPNAYFDENNRLVSSTWHSAGTEIDFYGHRYYVSSTAPYDTFDGLTSFIETHCPDISYLDYVKAAEKHVHIEEVPVNDNYTEYRWSCDFIPFCKELTDMGYDIHLNLPYDKIAKM